MSIKLGKNWVCWKEKHRPVSALTGKQKGWTRNLASYAEATQFCLDNAGYQLGYCFSSDQPYIGLDLDSCINEDGEVEQWAKDIVLTLIDNIVIDNRSVSGTGLKLILKCSDNIKRGVRFINAAQHGDHAPQVDLFVDSKYFALTGVFQIDEDASEVSLDVLSEVMGFDVTDVVSTESSNSKAGDTSPDKLRTMLQKLDIAEYSDRGSWMRIMSASHHATGGSEEGLEIFKEWSAGDESSYDEGYAEQQWTTLRNDGSNPITVASLIHELPAEARPRIEPEADFEVIEAPQSDGRLLGWLLDENSRNHSKVVSQLAIDPEGAVIRYVSDWDCWILFDGAKWIRDSKGARVQQLIVEFIAGLADRVPDMGGEDSGKATSWISSLLNYNNTMGVARSARGERGLMISLESMGKNDHLLNFQNGTYNLEEDKFKGHNPNDFLFNICNTNYVEGQEAPLWDKVINDIFAGDRELISYIRRLCGASISGDCSDPVFNVFYGDGANGKSTVVGTISDLLGAYAQYLPSELFDKNKALHPTYQAALYGARLAVIAECESDLQLAEATIKKLTSTDKIEARRMRQDPWHFTPTHTSILCTNHLPQIKGSDLGVWRRIKLVPFLVNLSDVKDVTIPERLKAEYAGVANWLLQGHREFKAVGIGSCKAVDDATAGYRADEDEFQREFDDLFTICRDAVLPVVDAHQIYAASGGRLGRKKFCAEMARMGFSHSRARVNGVRASAFTGIKMSFKEFGG